MHQTIKAVGKGFGQTMLGLLATVMAILVVETTDIIVGPLVLFPDALSFLILPVGLGTTAYYVYKSQKRGPSMNGN